MESVNTQLDNFDTLLFDSLEFQIIINTNRNFWEETGSMDVESADGIENAIDYGFEQMFARYRYCRPVLDILENWYEQLHNIMWISMDVPYPEDLDRHAFRVLTNCRRLFYDQVWGRLEQAMIREVSRVQIIQRNWKEAYYNPNFALCKKRIRRWAPELEEEITRIRAAREC